MFRPSRGSFFDPDTPPPAKSYDNDPAGPPKRICAVCGLKYFSELGKESPCRHVRKDGTLRDRLLDQSKERLESTRD